MRSALASRTRSRSRTSSSTTSWTRRSRARCPASYPTFEQALGQGFAFNFVNEQRKVQISDAAKFADPVRRLNDAISSPKFLADLEHVTGIPRLMADEKLGGGGMHLTGSGGRLDVHVDFNLIEERQLFRRLNILIYLNTEWKDEWGGQIELWDSDVKVCHLSSLPVLNRCLIFETSDISYHGVSAHHGAARRRPQVVRRLLLHARGARGVERRVALDDLQGEAG